MNKKLDEEIPRFAYVNGEIVPFDPKIHKYSLPVDYTVVEGKLVHYNYKTGLKLGDVRKSDKFKVGDIVYYIDEHNQICKTTLRHQLYYYETDDIFWNDCGMWNGHHEEDLFKTIEEAKKHIKK